jgi:hypothetical protein
LVGGGTVGVKFATGGYHDVARSELVPLAVDLYEPPTGGDDHHLASDVDMGWGDAAGAHCHHSCVEATVVMRALPPLRRDVLSLVRDGAGELLDLLGPYDSHRREPRPGL